MEWEAGVVSFPLPHLGNRMRNILPFIVMFCSLPTLAAPTNMDCTLLEKKTWEKVSPDEQFDQTSCACKPFPDDATQAIITAGTRLLIVDVSTGEVRSDGGDIDMVTNNPRFNIDTARYWVAPGVRAFGVRGWVSPYHQYSEESVEHLNLYVKKGNRIVPIVEKLITQDIDKGIPDEGCTDPSMCTGTMSEFKVSVEITKTVTNGYFDLALVETSRHCGPAESIAACKNSETWRKELKRTYTIRYDGVTYRAAKDVPSDVTLFDP
jgi:hypothetical protein